VISDMNMQRRTFLGLSAAAGALALGPASLLAAATGSPALPPPISREERMRRIQKAQTLMRAAGLRAVLVEAGSSLVYFTGIKWWRSERLTAAVIPAEGAPLVVTPAFEEPSVRESLAIDADVRTWNENESPARLIADWLKSRGAARGPVGVENTVRFFAFDGLHRLGVETRDDAGVVRSCRVVKSPAELALMQAANDITISAYREAATQIERGMTPDDIGKRISAVMSRLGAQPEFTLVLIGEASAYPHGSGKPQHVRDGETVLLDCGCSVQGYQSDISRTLVYGEASREQRDVWQQVRLGQQIAFDAARPGTAAGAVDDAVRSAYAKAGYGPGYKLPGTPHRTGHGIGLDGHEPVNIVQGESTPLAPGMCFSIEPGLYLPGRFGVRLEDCVYMGTDGPQWFTRPPPSIDTPFG
jgi:Xaa-Pro dipeptidase